MTHFPETLLSGYRIFTAQRFQPDRAHYQTLANQGQKPETMVISCCDSRATPENIFNADPGDIFVMRNIANQVPPYQPDGKYHGTSAALEYAVQALKVKNIVVLGHARCGGIANALDSDSKPLSEGDFIGRWMNLIAPAANTIAANTFMTKAERQTALEHISIRYSVNNLRTFPWIAKHEQQGLLTLHGAWFDIESGELWIMKKQTGDFIRVCLNEADNTPNHQDEHR